MTFWKLSKSQQKVNILTINKLDKLTMLWTTGPRCIHSLLYQPFKINSILIYDGISCRPADTNKLRETKHFVQSTCHKLLCVGVCKTEDIIWAVPCEKVSSGIWGQQRPRSDCSDEQSDQGLSCPQTESLDTIECCNGEKIPPWYFAHDQNDRYLCIWRLFDGTFSLDTAHMRDILYEVIKMSSASVVIQQMTNFS